MKKAADTAKAAQQSATRFSGFSLHCGGCKTGTLNTASNVLIFKTATFILIF
jgi:hypothetical protein